ncbi:MAG: hypothetical protein ACD_11C00001G0003, partial [uncultured bacterium]
MGEKLDPTNQAHIKEFAKKHRAGFDALGNGEDDITNIAIENPDSEDAGADLKNSINEEFDKEISSLEKERATIKNPKEGEPSSNKIRKIKKLRADLFEIFDDSKFDDYKREKSNAKRLKEYARLIIKKVSDDDSAGEFNAMELLSNASKKAKSVSKILNNIKANKEKEASELKEAERKAKEAQEARLKKEEEEKIKAAEEAEIKKAQEEIKEGFEAEDQKKRITELDALIKAAKAGLKVAERSYSKSKSVNKSELLKKISSKKESIKKLELERDALTTEDAKVVKQGGKKKIEIKVEPEPEIELTMAEKNEAIDFFDNNILSLYEAKREEMKWNGYSDEVKEFLKVQFITTANDLNFLDGDDFKIGKAWDVASLALEATIKIIESRIAKETQPEVKKETGLTLEQIEDKLRLAGATEEDITYFFSLHKKDREDFLLSSDEELDFRIEKLREKREAEEKKGIDGERRSEAENSEATEKLKRFGEYMKDMRKIYLQKEYEFNKTTSGMKRFFHMEKVDMGNAQEELDDAKKDYQEAVENYLNLVVQTEKPADAEAREIIFRYAKFGEALQVMNAKEDIKFEKNPRLENFKKILGTGTVNLLDKYKELLGKPKELIAKKTNSKTLAFGGGMVAVGGAMAFASSYIPGLRAITLPLGIAVATKGFYERAENKAVIEKEKSLEKEAGILEKRLEYINNLGADVNEAFKKELGLTAENILEEVAKEREAVGKRMALSLVKAIAVSSTFYMAGQAIGGFFRQDDLSANDSQSNQHADNEVAPGAKESDKSVFEKAGESKDASTSPSPLIHPLGTAIHSQTNFPHPLSTADYEMPGNVDDPILENEAEIRETLEKMKNPNHFSSPEAHHEDNHPAGEINNAESNATGDSKIITDKGELTFDRDTEAAEPLINEGEYEGIKLNELGQGPIEVIEGKGIKDMVAALLAKNYENLTEGKMGWNPDKYASVEEWA